MLTVSRDSWHFNTVMFYRDNLPSSLCTYFWSFLGSLALSLLLFMLAEGVFIIILTLLLDPAITFGVAWYLDVYPTRTFASYVLTAGTDSPIGSPVMWYHFCLSYIAWSLAAWGGFKFWLEVTDTGYNWKRSRELARNAKRIAINEEPKPLTGWGVFVGGVLAIKHKVCPLIKYVK